ncbi:MAG: hypothetical protein J6G98_01270 [Bacilli bacterium]|nr:hypothetical protein [Bacilli bacterium]
MKIKLIKISPNFLNCIEENLLSLEKKTFNDIKKIKRNITNYEDEIDMINVFYENYGKDKEITNYITILKDEINKCTTNEKNAVKTLKKIKTRKRKIEILKKMI